MSELTAIIVLGLAFVFIVIPMLVSTGSESYTESLKKGVVFILAFMAAVLVVVSVVMSIDILLSWVTTGEQQ